VGKNTTLEELIKEQKSDGQGLGDGPTTGEASHSQVGCSALSCRRFVSGKGGKYDRENLWGCRLWGKLKGYGVV